VAIRHSRGLGIGGGSERGLKVLMISKALTVGAYHAKLRELSRLGVELTVVVPRKWLGEEMEPVRPDGYELLVMDCAFSWTPHLHFYPKISEVVAREVWDLVHIDEEPFHVVTYQALRACLREGRKAVFFTWQNMRITYPPPFQYFERFSDQRADGAIAGSDEVRDVLVARRFSKLIGVIPQFGVDTELFQPRDATDLREKLGLGGKFAVGYVGRIVKQKGIADLIQALAALPERCVLVLVGSGDFESRARVVAEELGVDSRIRWVSHVSSVEIPQYMNALDVVVLPSRTTLRWKEQFGRVLIEAMACETAVVGSNSGEIPNVIGDAGRVFPEENVEALVEDLHALYESSEIRGELGARGRARVLKNFTHRRIAEETVKFYESVVGGSYSRELKEAVTVAAS